MSKPGSGQDEPEVIGAASTDEDASVPEPERTPDERVTRRPASVYGVGQEPDPRFSMANERTALAWMRTSLAIVAGGIALISLASLADLPRWTPLIGAIACLGGGACAVRALSGWAHIERSLRLDRPLPAPRALLPLAVGVATLAVVMVVLSIVELVQL